MQTKGTGGVAQLLECQCLPSMGEALGSIPGITKNENNQQ
jgi:hypothetical protein